MQKVIDEILELLQELQGDLAFIIETPLCAEDKPPPHIWITDFVILKGNGLYKRDSDKLVPLSSYEDFENLDNLPNLHEGLVVYLKNRTDGLLEFFERGLERARQSHGTVRSITK